MITLKAWLLAALVVAALAAPAQATPPPIGHVFVIVLENKNYDSTFGAAAGSSYLAHDLTAQGELLTHYYGIGHASLDNYIAMISGQAPNPTTQSDCQFYTDFVPGTIGADGQAMGTGCVYPATVKTVADQLTAKGIGWGGYMEDMGNTAGAPQACRHPDINGRDDTQSARANDQYAARHNPFVYFHSLVDSGDCVAHDVPLDRLPAVLGSSDVPAFTFITPDLCSDGHDASCADGGPGGYQGIDNFLRKWVPMIQASTAFKDGGLLVVTFDESESGSDACCVQDHPNTPSAGGSSPGPGGGRTGAVLLSPYIKAGTTNDTPYNHYSLLRSVEDIFGLAPLGLADKATGFGDDVYNGPRCFNHPLPAGATGTLPKGTLIASIKRTGRVLKIQMAHAADVSIKAKPRHGRSRVVLKRHVAACATLTKHLKKGTRSAVVTAAVHGAREQRTVKIS
jgi:hypothetical protein